MEFNSYMQKCGDDDVIQLRDAIYRIGKLKAAIKYGARSYHKIPSTLFYSLQEFGINLLEIATMQEILTNGIDAEILKINAKGWQKGNFKINLTLEFIPDEPEIEEAVATSQSESPLDDLRKLLNENS